MSIYLDNASTTAVTEPVLAEMLPFFSEQYGNPSSLHSLGRTARQGIGLARKRVAQAINAEPEQIIFTSGATESNNWIMESFEVHYEPTEHHSILNNAKHTPAGAESANLYSRMLVNNETGEIYPTKELLRRCTDMSAFFHTDATQAFGHIPVDVREIGCDFLSLSGHKFHAPKGVGILYVKNPKLIKLTPVQYGGGQENGLRSGTENTAAIIGMGKAAELYGFDRSKQEALQKMRDAFEERILSAIPDVIVNARDKNRIATISSLSFRGIESEALALLLDREGIYISNGSACNSGSLEPSATLKAIGVPNDYINGTIRISMSEFTTAEELEKAAHEIRNCVALLRGLRCG